MIEKIVKDYLTEKLNIPVYMEIPKNPIYPYVVVEKTGSSGNGLIFDAMIVVQSYADSLFNAATLNELVKSKMLEIITLDEVSKCELNSDYNYSDTTKKEYRYQAVFDLVHY